MKPCSAFHWLKSQNRLSIYKKHLQEKKGKEDGSELWLQVPQRITGTVIQSEIGEKTMDDIFKKVDKLVGDKIVDIIIGDPPCQSYSFVGRIRDPQNMKNEPRNFLYKYYIYFLKRYALRFNIF